MEYLLVLARYFVASRAGIAFLAHERIAVNREVSALGNFAPDVPAFMGARRGFRR
jgi:hypothetical protein